MTAILLAENDPRTLDLFPRLLSDHLPHVRVDICTSSEDLSRNRELSTYDTIAISPILLQGYRLLKYKADRHLLSPLLLTAGLEDRALAAMYLEKDAFDLIVKPIVPPEAIQTVKLALWQSKLLGLLTSRDRASARFREHMLAFPHALYMEKEFASKLAAYERTLQALNSSFRLLLDLEDETALFDMAASVEYFSRQRALERLLTLCKDGPVH